MPSPAANGQALSQPLFAARGLTIAIAQRTLLSDVSIELQRGQIVGLRGPSGSGKTTLLRALAGLIDAPPGRLLLNGRTPEAIGWPQYRRQVVYLPQRAPMLPLSVRENLALPFRYAAANTAYDEQRALHWLRLFRLEAAQLDQPAERLSEGEKQRVSLVRALLLQPSVLLLDEPTSALDEEARDTVEAGLLSALAAGEGAAAVLISHDSQQFARLNAKVIDLSAHRPSQAGARQGAQHG